MSLLDQEILIISNGPGSVDVRPRGTGCDYITRDMHDFFLTTYAVGFEYQICGRCGAVRIKERR
jgi:hypothetical protein